MEIRNFFPATCGLLIGAKPKLFKAAGLTVKKFENPCLPLACARILTLLWLLVITRLLPVHCPATKFPVTAGVSVFVSSLNCAVPVKLTTVLLKASFAVMVTENDVPAVRGEGMVVNSKRSSRGITSNAFDAPCLPLPVTIMTLAVRLLVMVTFCVSTPALNDWVIDGEIDWLLSVKVAVLVKAVTVLLYKSLALMVILNCAPVAWLPIGSKVK